MNLKEVHIKEDRSVKRKQRKIKYINKSIDKLKRKMNFGVKKETKKKKKRKDYT